MKFANFLKKHSSAILTAAGAVGVVLTAVTAVKATPKAMALIGSAEKEKGEKLTKLETLKAAAPIYIPAVFTGVLTISCIAGANMLNKKQQNAIAGAYAVVSSSYQNYRNKTREFYGKEADDKIISAVAAEKAKKVHLTAESLLSTTCLEVDTDSEEEQLFYDSLSERYFLAKPSKVIEAEYHLNRNYALGERVTLNTFYDFLGLEPIDEGDVLAWEYAYDYDDIVWIDFNHRKTELEDGMECYILEMPFEPRNEDYFAHCRLGL